MNKFVYFKLEIKRYFKLIPQILLGTIALSIVVGAIVFCAGKMLYSTTSLSDKKNIVFSSQDDSQMTSLIVSTLKQSESINSVCNIIESDYDTAISMPKNSDTVASIIIPSGFMNSLMNGNNLPITIYFSSTKSIFSMIISELTISAQTSLKTAQSGVYVLYDYYKTHNALSYENEANQKLNFIYLEKAFSREHIFTHHKITATNNLSLANYYIASGIMLILLLLGCIFIFKLNDTSKYILFKLRNNKVGSIIQIFTHIIATFLVLFILLSIGIIALYGINLYTCLNITFNIPLLLANSIVVCLCCSSIICCIGNILSNKNSGILLYFLLTISSCFISGAFIPSILLPEIFTKLSKYLPTTYIQNSIGIMLNNSISTDNIYKMLLYTFAFSMLNIFIYEIHFVSIPHFKKKGTN